MNLHYTLLIYSGRSMQTKITQPEKIKITLNGVIWRSFKLTL